MKKKIRLIEVIETITFLLLILTLGWLLFVGIVSIFTDPLSFDPVTAFGYVSILSITVFILPLGIAFLRNKNIKKK